MQNKTRKCLTLSEKGFTYLELLIVVTIAGILLAGLMEVVSSAVRMSDDIEARNRLGRDARMAMQKMSASVLSTRLLILPLIDNPNTNWPENIREQTIPASAPVGSSTLATAVLAVTLPEDIDLDNDGTADADDDGDGLFDEDHGKDSTNDGASGIYLIDDDGDGFFDEGHANDDDEDNSNNEDILNGLDDDGDGAIDEDYNGDVNDDLCSGLCGVDDDGDGAIDEHGRKDDDEDGSDHEDGYNPVVYYLQGSTLVERMPLPWDANEDGEIDGLDFIESGLAENVTLFRIERSRSSAGIDLVNITLQISDPVSGESISLQSQVRVGGRL